MPAQKSMMLNRLKKVLLLQGILIVLALFQANISFAIISISKDQALQIGMKVWYNESGNSIAGLTAWNEGEDFASLGIGHFIWYPQKRKSHFADTFPELIRYMKTRHIQLPWWLNGKEVPPCFWPNRTAFLKDQNSSLLKELRTFLLSTINIQAEFIALKAETSLNRILANVPEHEKAAIKKYFYYLARTPKGIYALTDYINFKGEGLGQHEHYHHQGWGLLQVLRFMSYAPRGLKPIEAFVWSAHKVLLRRVKNSPAHRNEKRWLPGWEKRITSYL